MQERFQSAIRQSSIIEQIFNPQTKPKSTNLQYRALHCIRSIRQHEWCGFIPMCGVVRLGLGRREEDEARADWRGLADFD
jgi:hypothetical protein